MKMEWMTEHEIDKFGYQYICYPASLPDNATTKRKRFDELPRSAVTRITPVVPFDVRSEAIKQAQRLNSSGLIANNEALHRLLTAGIKASYQVPRQVRRRLAINPEKRYYISGFTKAIYL